MAQAGEFGFVLLSFTVANAVIPQPLADQLSLVVALSMLLTPALFILLDKVIAPRFAAGNDRPADDITDPAKIIIAGHGRMGGIVNRAMRGARYETTVIDFSVDQLEMLRKFDMHVHYDDATRPDLLHAARIAEAAEAYAPTIPNHENEAYLARIREMRDDWEEQLRGDMRPASFSTGD